MFGRFHDDVRARKLKLAYIERSQPLQETARALHGEIAVKVARLSGKIVVARQVDHAIDLSTVAATNLVERPFDRIIARQIARNEMHASRSAGLSLEIQTYDRCRWNARLRDGASDEPFAAGDQNSCPAYIGWR